MFSPTLCFRIATYPHATTHQCYYCNIIVTLLCRFNATLLNTLCASFAGIVEWLRSGRSRTLGEHISGLFRGETVTSLPQPLGCVIQLCFVCVENFMEKHLNSHVGFSFHKALNLFLIPEHKHKYVSEDVPEK